MARIILPTRGVQRAPPERPVINRDSWQADGLEFWCPLVPANRPVRDLVSGVYGTHGQDSGAWVAFPGLRNTVDVSPTGAGPQYRVTWKPGTSSEARSIQDYPMSIVGWFNAKSDNSTWSTFFAGAASDYETTFVEECHLLLEKTTLKMGGRTGGTTVGYGNAITASTWYHGVWTHSSATDHRLYINGVETMNNTTSYPTDPLVYWVIGGKFYSSFWDGYIKECRAYSRAFTASEAHEMYSPEHRWDLWWQRKVTYSFLSSDHVFHRLRRS